MYSGGEDEERGYRQGAGERVQIENAREGGKEKRSRESDAEDRKVRTRNMKCIKELRLENA